MGRLELASTVTIDAAAGPVWDTLTDAASWPDWCGPVRAVHAVPDRWEPGARLSYTLAMGPGVPVRFDVRLVEVVPAQLLSWTAHKWWGVRGDRSFRLAPAAHGTAVTDTKVFESRTWPVGRLYPRRTVHAMSERWLHDLAREVARRLQ